METETKLKLALEAADEAKAIDVASIDLKGKTTITDHFVICTGTSDVHVRSVAEKIQEKLKASGERALRVEGFESAVWVLLDFGDVVVHVMREEPRKRYDIETFWANAPSIENARSR
ncbi:MAG: ribosome silencing factor [Armatimonadetes bacterium]|nr:ribosome silencing factor [Armatimonadota bacterium]